MKSRIGFIVPSEQVKLRIKDLLKEEVNNGTIIVETLKHNKLLKQAQNLINKGVSAIIGRGGTYIDLKNNLNIPVVDLGITTSDILYALSKAKKLSKKIYLILQESIFFEYEKWKELLDINIEIFTFSSIDQIEEIEEIILKIKALEEDAVAVGGVIVTGKAEEYGLKTIFITNTDDSILETYHKALEIVSNIKNEKKKLNLLTSILNNIDDAVLVVNKEGEIEHFNAQAKRLFNKSDDIVIHRNILDVFPDINFILEVLKDKVISNHIFKIHDFTLNLTAVPLEISKEKIGVVCIMQDITEIQKLEKKLRYKLNQKGLKARYTFDDIITNDEAMIRLIDNAKEFSTNNSTILIYGESGTGKELFAQSIHNWSQRKKDPFVAINCAALSDSLLESELFGYEEGAFTGARKGGKQGLFELAHGGTIFLDEINSISPKLQAKLLRVLEEKEVMRLGSDYIIPLDVRVIAAANEDLINKVMKDEFRRDLFYRLSVLELRIPSLREKKGDIILLFKKFLKEMADQVPSIPKELEKRLKEHMWLGNIRELRNVAERYSLLKDKSRYNQILGCEGLEDSKRIMIDDNMKIDLDEINRVVEELVIQDLINKGLGKNEIAGLLGISRTALWKKINR